MSLGLFVSIFSPLGQMVLVVVMWKVHIKVRPDLVFLFIHVCGMYNCIFVL